MPLKKKSSPLEQTDPLSAKIGAVNTSLSTANLRLQHRTRGIVLPLEKRLSLREPGLVLGPAEQPVPPSSRARPWSRSLHPHRTPRPAQKLARQSAPRPSRRKQSPRRQFDVIINATPVAMAGNKAPRSSKPATLTPARFASSTTRWRRRSSAWPPEVDPHHPGVEMFVQQGARQFEIFTGKPAPEEEMFRVSATRWPAEPKPPLARPPHPRPQRPPRHLAKAHPPKLPQPRPTPPSQPSPHQGPQSILTTKSGAPCSTPFYRSNMGLLVLCLRHPPPIPTST